MKRLFSFLFWCFLFLVVCLGLDQLLVRVEMPLPVLREVRTFYVDFRTRLVHLAQRVAEEKPLAGNHAGPSRSQKQAPALPKSADPPLPSRQEKKIAPTASSPAPAGKENSPRYLYVDGKGALLFADRLEDIPAAYRKDAQLLDR